MSGNFPVAPIDPYDVAAVAFEALTSDAHAGRSYSLTGTERLRPAEQVEILSRLLDRPLRFEELSRGEALAILSQTYDPHTASLLWSPFAARTSLGRCRFLPLRDSLGAVLGRSQTGHPATPRRSLDQGSSSREPSPWQRSKACPALAIVDVLKLDSYHRFDGTRPDLFLRLRRFGDTTVADESSLELTNACNRSA